jgi:aminoglycoside 3-N-acetyltransferase I
MNIERLGSDDIAALRGLNALFAAEFDDPESYTATPPNDAYLTRQLASSQTLALVAYDGDTLIGGLVAYELPKLERARSEIYIYDLAVAEAHRRKGVATALIEALKPFARNCGAWVIYVQADYGDEPAVALYTKLGVREDVMHFDIGID